MRTTLAALCVLGLFGCERRNDRTAAEVDRPGTDKTATAVARDSAAGSALQWGPAPPGLPAGGRAAIIDGDPSKAGPFTVRVDMPKGYEVRPHHHPTSERLTLIEGAVMLGHGKKWDDGKLAPVAVGAGANMAAREPHFVRAKERSIVEVRSTGPFEIIYETPGDDPRKAPVQ